MSITDVFSKTFNILKDNPKIVLPNLIFTSLIGGLVLYSVFSLLSGVYGISILGSHAVQAGVHQTRSVSEVLALITHIIPIIIFVYLIALFVNPLLNGMYINIADQGYRKGKISLSTAFSTIRRSYFSLFATELLITIVWIVVLLVFAVVFLLPTIGTGGLLHLLWLIAGCLIFLALSIFIGICLYESYAIVVIERIGAINAVRKSIEIGKQNLGSIFKIFLVTPVIVLVYSVFIGMLQTALEFVFSIRSDVFFGTIIAQIINFVLNSGLGAWIAMIPAGFYFDYVKKARSRKRK
jgi:hypothetical protein